MVLRPWDLARITGAFAPAAVLLAVGLLLRLRDTSPETAALMTAGVAVVGLVGLLALLDLERFVLIVLVGAMVYPVALLRPLGTQVALADLLLVLVLGAWLVRAAVAGAPGLAITNNRLLAPTLGFTAVVAASLVWSTDVPLTVKFLVQIVEIVVVVPLVFASLPSSTAAIRTGMHAFVAVSAGLALITVGYFLPRVLAGDIDPQYLPGLHKNAIGSFLGVGVVLAYGLSLTAARPRAQLVLALVAVLELAGLTASMSRGALVGAAVGVAATSLLLRRRRLVTLGLLGVAIGAVMLVTLSATEALPPGGYASAEVRVASFANAVDKISAAPLLGTGGGTYRDDIPELGIGLADPNNMFLLTWAELGLFGMGALLLLLWRFGRLFVAGRHLPGDAATLGVVAGAAALSLLVHFQVDATWTRGTTTLCFAWVGVMVAVHRLAFPGGRATTVTTSGVGVMGWAPIPTAAAAATVLPAPPTAPAPPTTVLAPLPGVVHLLTSDAYAGIERHVVRLTRELRARGCPATIACPPGAAQLRAAAAASGVPVRPAAGARPATWLIALARELAGDPPQILHVHDGRAALADPLLARIGAPATVRTQHFMAPATVGRTGWRRRASTLAHRALNRRVAAYVCISESAMRAAAGRDELGDGELAVIAPGIDLPAEQLVAEVGKARRRADAPVVVFVGRLEREKRLELLVAAVPLVLAAHPACRFVIAGSGGAGPALRQQAERAGVAAAITWTGEVADPGAVLASAHVFVNPSGDEGFGLATAEAMAMGLPAVVMASGGSAELVADGVHGLQVPVSDAGALAAAVVRLLDDGGAAAQMGRAGRRRAVEAFGVERTAEATLALYRRVGPARST